MKIWFRDIQEQRFTRTAIVDLEKFPERMLHDGTCRRGGRYSKDATIVIQSHGTPEDCFKAGCYPIVSSRLRTILDSWKAAVEYLPVRLVKRNGKPLIGEWFIFNVLHVEDWFDWERSRYLPERQCAIYIETVVVKASRLGNEPLTASLNTIPTLIAVRDDVAESIVVGGCTGMKFLKPEECVGLPNRGLLLKQAYPI